MSEASKTWLMDLGNSRIKCAQLMPNGQKSGLFAIDPSEPDGSASLLQRLAPIGIGDCVWLASVASASRRTAVLLALRAAGLMVRQVQTRAVHGRLRIAYRQPAQLGVDRFLALLAASERRDGPWLLVSAGSALTVDLLAADGVHHGGMIVPMPEQMRGVLAQNFSQLDLPPGRVQDFADNTADAIASGAHAALLGLVERALRRARSKLGTAPCLLLSGGAAGIFAGLEYSPQVRLDAPVLDGMVVYLRPVADRSKDC